jgi:hypothetical protein
MCGIDYFRKNAGRQKIARRLVPGTDGAQTAIVSARIKMKPNKKSTLAESGALYLAHHKISQPRSALFQQLRIAGRKQTLVGASCIRRLHRDKGR